MKKRSCECCIIGAGPAGLGCALELSKQGIKDILIIDKNSSAGGLSRTDIFDGIRFDIGAHRFFTKSEEVENIWKEQLEDEFLPVKRLSRIFYQNIFFDYPIKPLEIMSKLGISESLAMAFSYLDSQLCKNRDIATFEDWIVQKFGRKLYETFFKVYTEKVWGIPCSQISSEWAEQRIKGLDALEVIKKSLIGSRSKNVKSLIEEFHYPRLGAGQMYQAMCDNAISKGAKIMLETKVVKINRKGSTITSVETEDRDNNSVSITAKQFFSSMPLNSFFTMLTPSEKGKIESAAGMLRYRDHITVDLLINKADIFPDHWIYVHSPKVRVARIANYTNFSKAMVGSMKKTALSAEYFTTKKDHICGMDDSSLGNLAVEELSEIGLLKKDYLEDFWIVRETEAYPVNYYGFEKYYAVLQDYLDRFSNLYSIGRGGLHKYNNQDHSLLSGLWAAKNYLKLPGSPYNLWNINTEAEYHETKKL